MPRRKTKTKKITIVEGEGFLSFLKDANKFLRKTKILSTVGTALGAAGVPYAAKSASVAKKLGYGMSRGAGITLAGGGGYSCGRRSCRVAHKKKATAMNCRR